LAGNFAVLLRKRTGSAAMVQLTVTSKGQITLTKSVLEHMNIKPGDKVDVELLPDGRVLLYRAEAAKLPTSIMSD
jgi:AbrB family looped-hinge helix DNA binding protein